jgi:hypothetical protein
VFDSSWDLTGALHVLYGDPSLSADVVTPRLAVEEDGLTTTDYGTPNRYPYSERLRVIHFSRKTSATLQSVSDARNYFGPPGHERRPACAPGYEGYGVEVFERL